MTELSADTLQNKATERDNNFDTIRVFAALLVIIGHAYPMTGTIGGPSSLGMGVHTLGVKIFFCLSGYLIVESWIRDPHPLRYLSRRLLRIVPALAAVVLISALVIGPFFTTQELHNYFSHPATQLYFRNIFLYVGYYLPGVFEGNPIRNAVNGSLWTLPVEFYAYCMVPIIYATLNRNWAHAISLATLVFCVCFDQWFRISATQQPIIIYATDVGAAAQLLVYFAIGSFFRIWDLARRIDLRVVVVSLAVAIIFPASEFTSPLKAYILNPVVTFGFAFGPRFLPLDADISYGMYLWAFPVAQGFVALGLGVTPISNALLTTIVVVPVAYLSWIFVEHPALKFKPTIGARV